ncbi:MAG: hypoxanthine phosphoribosyltransferase [Dehalococcoidia bacterium]
MASLRLLLSREEIERRVDELAAQIRRDYAGEMPIFLGVLKGAFIFLADLSRRMDRSPEIDFILLSSYGSLAASSGQVKVLLEPRAELKGRDVLIVEDIIDSGLSLEFIRDYVARRQPARLRVCALLARRRLLDEGLRLDYLGFPVGDGFLVGYGLDCREEHRTLPDVYALEEP